MALSTKDEIDLPLTRELLLDFENESVINVDNLPFKIDVVKKHFWMFFNNVGYQDDELTIVFKRLKPQEQYDCIYFGISCVATFVQANFTGPAIDAETEKFLIEVVDDVQCKKWLRVSNEDINTNTKFPGLLQVARSIFKYFHNTSVTCLWWYWRTIIIHQKVMDELSPTLLGTAESLEKEMKDLKLPSNMQALLELEQAQLFCEFRSVNRAEEHIKRAMDIIGMKLDFQGKLGKRTRFQDKDIAQLIMDINLEEKPGVERPDVKDIKVPTVIPLRDDVRLDKIEFANDDNKESRLTDLEQRTLLTTVYHMMLSIPMDDLTYEEMRPFVVTILGQKNTWSVRMATLLLRCKLEAKHNRTIERSLMQCEELVMALPKDEPHALSRIAGAFSTNLPPIWRTKEQYADLMLNLGLVKAALDVYVSLELWEEVIVCYTILKMRHKAADVIKQQLAVKETPKLWCLLGDATDDTTCYEKGWELSQRRSHRVQRHWGHYYFQRKDYEKCISHFEKSVSINPLQAIVWLRLGYAALESQRWQTAATAYRRYTTIEPNGFDAWNNLAQAYLKLGNRQSAHRALKDALRCNFDNWKIWENYLIVSANIGLWQEAIRSYHKLLDLKDRYLSVESLRNLVDGVLEQGDLMQPGIDIKKTQELVGRITSLCPTDGNIWELYSRLTPVPLLETQRLQRAYRCFVQGNTASTWPKDSKTCSKVLHICLRLGELVLADEEGLDTVTNSVRLNISAAISAAKKEEHEDLKPHIRELTSTLAKIIEKSKNSD